jgi:hypothetical protein
VNDVYCEYIYFKGLANDDSKMLSFFLFWPLKSILSFWYHRYIHMKYEVKLQLEGKAYKSKPRNTTPVKWKNTKESSNQTWFASASFFLWGFKSLGCYENKQCAQLLELMHIKNIAPCATHDFLSLTNTNFALNFAVSNLLGIMFNI